ncbi:MAG: LemA family protein [Hylemonella sp.]|uniref:LemA family protein n=1 Tax=Hylemonella sp. TaxID=2066020 RepID=UPI0022C40280|nr:LemA family protein [Hylemonella sp.]MCZ8253368.1 LemA family protein [Hylemonella sp.]
MLRWPLLLLLAALLGGCGVQDYRQLATERQSAWQRVQSLQAQRATLALNLLSGARALPTVPPAALTQLELARQQTLALPATSPDDLAQLQRALQAHSALSQALAPVLAQARLQAGLLPLVQQFEALGNSIRVAQQRYQLATQRHNQLLASFPSSLTARVQGLQPHALLPEPP